MLTIEHIAVFLVKSIHIQINGHIYGPMNELHAIKPDLPCDIGPGVVVVHKCLGEVVIVEVKLVAAGCAHRQEEDKCLHAGTQYEGPYIISLLHNF